MNQPMTLSPGMNQPMTLSLAVRVTNTTSQASFEKTFTKFPVRIGRSSLNDLPLDFGFVSQFHAVVERNEQTLFLRDLGSRNGSMVAGQRVSPHQPHDLGPAGFGFDVGSLRIQMATSMVPRTGPSDNRTAVLMAVDSDNPQNATEVWQAIAVGAPDGGRDPSVAVAHAVQKLARLYVPDGGAMTAESSLRFLGKMKQCLDLLFGAYVPLRDGCKQFQTQMDLHRPVGSAADDPVADFLATVRKPRDVAARALDWRDQSTDVQVAMQTTFADFVIHQLALIDGVMNGVRGLLRELSPKEIEAAYAKRGSSMRFGPWRDSALWKLYAEKHGDFAEEESQAFAVVFGGDFVQAYKSLKGEKERASVVPDRA
jgi:type VI secretion system protein ImpI